MRLLAVWVGVGVLALGGIGVVLRTLAPGRVSDIPDTPATARHVKRYPPPPYPATEVAALRRIARGAGADTALVTRSTRRRATDGSILSNEPVYVLEMHGAFTTSKVAGTYETLTYVIYRSNHTVSDASWGSGSNIASYGRVFELR